jgi:hypothetical protein
MSYTCLAGCGGDRRSGAFQGNDYNLEIMGCGNASMVGLIPTLTLVANSKMGEMTPLYTDRRRP